MVQTLEYAVSQCWIVIRLLCFEPEYLQNETIEKFYSNPTTWELLIERLGFRLFIQM